LALGLGLISAALIGSELTLTRLLSVVLWYHFAFFAISVALFGLGLAALCVHYFDHKLKDVPSALAWGSGATAVALICVDLAFINVTPDWFGGALGVFTTLTFKLLLLFALAAVPFFFGGFVVSLALTRHAAHASRLYFWDLLGAALGAVATLLLSARLPAPLVLCVFSGVACLAGLSFAAPSRRRGLTGVLTALATGIAALAFLGDGLFTLRVAKGIDVRQAQPELMRWNAFSLVSVLPSADFKGWGLSPRYAGAIPEQKTLIIDMNAMTPLLAFDGDFEQVDYVTYDLSAFVYRVRPGSPNACVIGAGGGKDVLAALSSGTRHVTAVEVNPIIATEIMRGSYRAMVGDLYGRSDVSLVVEDGRSFVRRTRDRFAVVHLSMVDTSAASAAGAYALSENALYTRDAFVDFFGALSPGGVLSVSSVSLPDLWVGTRLATIARSALGGGAVADRVVVLETPWLGVREARLYNFLVAPDGFDAATLQAVRVQAERLGFTIVHAPGPKVQSPLLEHELIRRVLMEPDAGALQQFLAGLPLDTTATTDDRPFFFYQNRLRDLPLALVAPTPLHLFGNGLILLAKVLLLSVLFALLLILLPKFLGDKAKAKNEQGVGWDLTFAGCLGIGFLLVELGLLHRISPYLGEPTLSLSVVIVAVLLGGAIGSRTLAARSEKVVRRTLLALVCLVCLAALLLPSLMDATRGWSPQGRGLVAAMVVFCVGVLLGVPMPAALRALSQRAPHRTAWFWAVNGGMSVLGTVLATLLALHYGSAVTVLVGAAVYVVALGLASRVLAHAPPAVGARPAAPAPQ
jgi:spermidine synthase